MSKKKSFDCVEMKRRIQEKMYEETKNMSHQELLAYYHQRIANSRFASFLNQPAGTRFTSTTWRSG